MHEVIDWLIYLKSWFYSMALEILNKLALHFFIHISLWIQSQNCPNILDTAFVLKK